MNKTTSKSSNEKTGRENKPRPIGNKHKQPKMRILYFVAIINYTIIYTTKKNAK